MATGFRDGDTVILLGLPNALYKVVTRDEYARNVGPVILTFLREDTGIVYLKSEKDGKYGWDYPSALRVIKHVQTNTFVHLLEEEMYGEA